MKFLVTGGAGFLGSHLVDKLLSENHEVVAVDNLLTGTMKNLSHLQNSKNFEFIHHDVINPLNLEVDGIFNLASPASPIHYQRDPVATIKTNLIGAINLLELAQRNNCKILQASTSEVYGDPSQSPQTESYWGNVNPIGIRACYDEGKRAAETVFFDFNRQNNVEITVARIFNTYGPRMAVGDGRVVSNFIVQSLRNEPITIYGEGQQTRSFCYASDLISGLMKLFFETRDFTGPMNIGNSHEITVKELASNIIQLTKSKSELIFQELPQDDPVQRKPDLTLAKSKINWDPEVDLVTGLRATIEYFKSCL